MDLTHTLQPWVREKLHTNPCEAVLTRLFKKTDGTLRAFLDGEDLLVWEGHWIYHNAAAAQIFDDPMRAIPLYLRKINITVTDYVHDSAWYRDPELAALIANHTKVRSAYAGKVPEIRFYDGLDWSKLPQRQAA